MCCIELVSERTLVSQYISMDGFSYISHTDRMLLINRSQLTVEKCDINRLKMYFIGLARTNGISMRRREKDTMKHDEKRNF